MRRVSLWMPGLAASVLACGLLAVGCGGGKTDGDKKAQHQENKENKPAAKKKGKQVLAVTDWGTLKGKAVLDGAKPANLDEMTTKLREEMAKKDKAHCLESASDEEKSQFDWRISPDGGVGNVVVWLMPAKGYIFKADAKDKTWKDEIVMDQPHCAFEPHVAALYAGFNNPETKKLDPAQKFVVKNSAEILHNTNYKAPDGSAENFAIEPKRSKEIGFSPDDMRPVEISCNVHPWMRAYVWAFDHPYFAVTDKDGNFEIKHIPAGVDVEVYAWHEKGGLQNLGTRKFKAGENTESIKMPAK